MKTEDISKAANHLEYTAAKLQEQADAAHRFAKEVRQAAAYAPELPHSARSSLLSKWKAAHDCGGKDCPLAKLG